MAMTRGIYRAEIGRDATQARGAWSSAVAAQHDEVVRFLRLQVEALTDGRRTVREAKNRLIPQDPRIPNYNPDLCLTICDPGRSEGVVTKLSPTDDLYIVFEWRAAQGMLVWRAVP